MKTSFTNYTRSVLPLGLSKYLLRADNRRLRREFVKLVIIRTIREIRLYSLLEFLRTVLEIREIRLNNCVPRGFAANLVVERKG